MANRCTVVCLLLLGCVGAQEPGSAASEAEPPPACIEVYSGNPDHPCPTWSVGQYNIAVGRTSLKKPVWHNSANSDALFRWHPRNGWVIGKLSDSTGMSYRCMQGKAADTTPLSCDSYGHPDDVCKVRACGTTSNTPEVGDGAGKEL